MYVVRLALNALHGDHALVVGGGEGLLVLGCFAGALHVARLVVCRSMLQGFLFVHLLSCLFCCLSISCLSICCHALV